MAFDAPGEQWSLLAVMSVGHRLAAGPKQIQRDSLPAEELLEF
jgi:hypothetical protein